MRKRNIKKQIWIDVKEDNLLKQKSKVVGLSESEFIRSMIKGYRIKEQPTDEIKQFQRELYGIANNINQIANRVSLGAVHTQHTLNLIIVQGGIHTHYCSICYC